MTEAIRVVTMNIHKGLSQFNRRMVIHELREGLRTLAPDLVFLQEVQGLNERHAVRFPAWPNAPQHEFLAPSDWHHAYGRNRVHHHGHYGNAILSRFRILSTENEDVSDHRFERRGLLHCVVEVPGWRRNLHCVCVHLSLHEGGRGRQLDALGARLEVLCGHDEPIVVAGDFNHAGAARSPRHDRSDFGLRPAACAYLPELDAVPAAGPDLRARLQCGGGDRAPRPTLVLALGPSRARRSAQAFVAPCDSSTATG